MRAERTTRRLARNLGCVLPLGLAAEAFEEFAVLRQLCGEQFERHAAAEHSGTPLFAGTPSSYIHKGQR